MQETRRLLQQPAGVGAGLTCARSQRFGVPPLQAGSFEQLLSPATADQEDRLAALLGPAAEAALSPQIPAVLAEHFRNQLALVRAGSLVRGSVRASSTEAHAVVEARSGQFSLGAVFGPDGRVIGLLARPVRCDETVLLPGTRLGRLGWATLGSTGGAPHWGGGGDRWATLDPDVPLAAGSLAKVICALGVLRLSELGMLPLRTLISDVLQTPHTQITVAHLLAHEGGLPRDLPEEDLLQAVAAAEPAGPSYSNAGYAALGLVIESVTGMPAARWLQQAVLERAGMRDASFDAARVREPAFMASGSLLTPMPVDAGPATAFGLVCSLRDLVGLAAHLVRVDRGTRPLDFLIRAGVLAPAGPGLPACGGIIGGFRTGLALGGSAVGVAASTCSAFDAVAAARFLAEEQ